MIKTIGNTPLIKIKYEYEGKTNYIYTKLESYNLTGSIKDRAAYYIITKAKEAQDSYSKSAVKRKKLVFLLNEYEIDKATGENAEFAKFLRKNFTVGVAEKEDGSYSFILGDWQVVTSESK